MPQRPLRPAVATAAGALPGAALAATLGAVAVLRRTKPLHPVGRVGQGVLDVTSPRPALGVPLFASQGERPCLVRWSRAMGLPRPLPDFEGLALRFEDPTSDVLLASTGTGAVGRHLLVLRRPGHHGAQSTLLPVATKAGPLLLRADPVDEPAEGADGAELPTRFDVALALGSSDWDHVGSLRVTWGDDRPQRFDPVEHQLPGTEQYPVVRSLREPAYAVARLAARARTRPA